MIKGNKETVARELAFVLPGSFTQMALPPPAFTMNWTVLEWLNG